MRRRLKNFSYALHNLVNNDDYLRYITDGKMSYDKIGRFQTPLDGKKNMSSDFCRIFSDVNVAIKEAYNKI